MQESRPGEKRHPNPGAGTDGTPPESPVPRWKEDFPIEWESDHYITRREFSKFLALGSGLLAGANLGIAAAGTWFRKSGVTWPRVRIGRSVDLAPGRSLLFRYPTDADPAILVRTTGGALLAYSQVCTHLSCAVVHRPGSETLDCPCHHGLFSVQDGLPIAGPPARRLPRIRVEESAGDLYATGVEV